jgi:glycosyltransferase involved in cell wall biosynthesis
MNPGDVAWIQAFCVPMATVPVFEQKLKNHSVSYIFHLMDDLFDIDFLKQGAINRCKLADLVGVPTPQLAQRVWEVVPSANVEVFEEPIDIARLDTGTETSYVGTPVVLWCGNPYNLQAIQELLDILRKIRKQIPFTLRVICGEQPPRHFFDGLDIEWKKFEHATEGQLIAGSWFGIAPMADSPYNRCKGAYKVKTYLAAGLPVVASPVGFQADLVQGSRNIGLLPETPARWEKDITSLLVNPSLLVQMRANARTYAQQRFSYSATTPNWVAKLQHHFPSLAARNSTAH